MNFVIVKSYEAVRRSTRVRAQIPLRVTSLDPEIPFTESCLTIVINTQGCGVRLSRPVEPGVAVQLDQLPTGQVVTAKVANCVPLGAEGKHWLVGLAFDEVANVWGIRPAPEDWGQSQAAASAPLPDKSKSEWPYSVFSNKGEAHPGRK